ncbi:MAG: MoxR family ATPase [Polyangiaceae bacterium]
MSSQPSWFVFRGVFEARKVTIPEPPPWRRFPDRKAPAKDYPVEPAVLRAPFRIQDSELVAINTALQLRRPLLVTGKPGAGKSTLAHAIAFELSLGRPLVWPINTRSTLQEGLYRYDAVGRLQEANLRSSKSTRPPIGQFLRLGPLGTALAPRRQPRVLLIDEIDKSDIDFPNDLLHVLETAEFEIPELSRSSKAAHPKVRVHDGGHEIVTDQGWVRAAEFPVVVMTSNGERDFPPAFLRRCVRVELPTPKPIELSAIVLGHLEKVLEGLDKVEKEKFTGRVAELAEDFFRRAQQSDLATDQLMNAAFLAQANIELSDELKTILFRSLAGGPSS